MILDRSPFKLIFTIFLTFSLTACFDSGGDDGDGSGLTSTTLPALTQLPVFSSVLGSKVTVNTSGLDVRYSYTPYVSTLDFTDSADAVPLGGSITTSSTAQTWDVPLTALGINELNQDYTLYVKWVTNGYNGEKSSALSEATQFKILAPIVELTKVSAIGAAVTIEWPVEAGKSYNIYSSSNGEINDYTLVNSTKELGGPFTSGKETFSPSSGCAYCTFAVTVVDGKSESIPVGLSNYLILSSTQPTIGLYNRAGNSVTVSVGGYGGLPSFRLYYSTVVNPTPANSTLLYDRGNSNNQGLIHDITTYYDASTGQPLTYYYFVEGYSTSDYTDSSGVVKTFVATSSLSAIINYTPSNNDFVLKVSSSNIGQIVGQQKVGNSLYFATGTYTYEYPLDGSDYIIYPSSVSVATKAFVVDLTDPTTHYGLSRVGVNKFTSGVIVDSLSLGSSGGESAVDMVQTSTDLYILTTERVIRVAKANVISSGSYTDLATGLTSATDIEIDEANGILYVAANSGVVSLPISGGALTVESATVATFIALDATATNLYSLERGFNKSIKKIVISSGMETDIKQTVSIQGSSSGLLKVYGDWLYFSADSGTYRLSLLDSSIDTVSSLSAIDVIADEAATEVFVNANNNIYNFPQDYYYPLFSAPTDIGTITAEPVDGAVNIAIIKPSGTSIDYYVVNGQIIFGTYGINTVVNNLTNGQLSNIEVVAHNLAGASDPVYVQETPVINTPSIVVYGGGASGQLSLSITWTNPIERDVTLNIYRSMTAMVDTTGTPISSVNYTGGADIQASAITLTSAYPDTGLADGTLYHYSATLNDGTGEGVGSPVVGTVPYTPYPRVVSVNVGSGPKNSGSVSTLNSKLYWANSAGIKELNGALSLSAVVDSSSVVMGLNSVELVSDSFDNSFYVTKAASSEIFKIKSDFTVDWIEASYVDAGFILEHLTIDGSSLYAAGSGQVIAVSLISGVITNLYASTSAIGKITQSGAYVYWVEGVNIKRIFKAGGGMAETLVTEGSVIQDMEVDSTGSVYYSILSKTSNFHSAIYKYDVVAMTTTLVTDSATAGAFVLDNGFVYTFLRKLPTSGVDYQQFAKYAADGTETILSPGSSVGTVSDLYGDGTGNIFSMSTNKSLFQVQ